MQFGGGHVGKKYRIRIGGSADVGWNGFRPSGTIWLCGWIEDDYVSGKFDLKPRL